MIWLRIDKYRLETRIADELITIETYKLSRGDSTHVRRGGRLVQYCRDEAEAVALVEKLNEVVT